MSGPFRLTLLGTMRVSDANGADITPRGRKMRGLIATLAMTPGHRATRERLVGLFWGDRGEEQARASLRQSLSDLRETAPAVLPLLEAGRLDIALAPGCWESDLARLEQLLTGQDAAAVAAALADLPTTLLGDLEGLSPGFDHWLLAERTRFETRLATAALAVAEQAAATDLDSARRIATAIQRLGDGTEDAVRLGMRLDHAAGDLAALHRRFRLLEAQLKRDYDAEPSPATRLLLTDLVAVPPPPRHPAPAAAPAPPGTGAPVVVVSPFAVLDGDSEAEALSRVLAADIEAALNRLPDLRVLSLGQPTPERLERVSRSAIAAYALGGSIRPGATGQRLNLRLVDIAEERVVWSHQLEAAREKLGAALDEAVERVAGAMLPAVERDIVATRRLDAAEPAAYALYLKGRIGILTARSLAEAQAAAGLLELALEQDPGFVNARLHLVLCYNTDFLQRIAGHDPTPWRQRAMKLAHEAVQLEPANADARARLGWCHLRHGDWERAEALLRESLALGPDHADNVEQCAFGLLHLGHVTEARRLLDRTFHLNPFPRSDYFADAAFAELLAGEAGRAADLFDTAGDPSLQYLALETAARGLAGVDARAHCDRLREGHAAIWVGSAPPADADIVATLRSYLPLRCPEHRLLVEGGLAAAGLQLEPRLESSRA
jgi:DNA-binding SARP family transcriptional activator/TolB-like protein